MNVRYRVELSQAERDELTALLSGGKHPVRRLKRAQILLAAAAGVSDEAIAASVTVGGSTVYRTKRRFVEVSLEAALSEGPRPGAERKLNSKEEALLVATACSKPPAGCARWTLELLANEFVELTEHDSLSRETIRRRLVENDLKPWRKKMWCVPKVDAEYVARMEDVLDLYAEAPDPNRPVICFDESPTQLIGETRLPIAAKPGQPERYDYEYKRNGTANLFVFVDAHRSWRKVSRRIGEDLVKEPDLAAQGKAAVSIAVLYWTDKGLNAAADRDDVMTICRRINGGTNGLRDQKLYLARAKAALAAPPASVEPAGEPTPAEPMPREAIRALQQRLAALGYHMVGKADGLIGSSTVAAVSAFQHDKDLPLTGEFDAATLAAIWSSDESRPLPASRAKGAPDASPVLASAIQLKAGSTLAATGGLAAWGAGALNQAEAAKDTWGRVQALAEPFASLRETLAGHPVLIVVSVAMVVGMVASRIAQTTIADYRSGRAP